MAFDTWMQGGGSGANLLVSTITEFVNACSTGVINTATQGETGMAVKAGVLDKFRAYIGTAAAGQHGTISGQVGVTNLTGAVTAIDNTTGELEDLTHSDSVANGDILRIRGTGAGSGNSAVVGGIGWHYAATAVETVIVGDTGAGSTFAYNQTTIQFNHIHGGSVASAGQATESFSQALIRAVGSYTNLRLNVSANTKTTGSTTFTIRKNGADGNSACVYAASATGIVEDVTHTDSLASGDLTCHAGNSTVAGTVTINQLSAAFISSAKQWDAFAAPGNSAGTNGATATSFNVLVGTNDVPSTTEALRQHRFRFATSARKLRQLINANGSSWTVTHTLRINGVDGSQTVTGVTAGSYEDTTHTDNIASGDLVCLKITAAGGTNSSTKTMLTLGTAASNTIATTFGAWSQTLTATVKDIVGITTVFGQWNQAITASVDATFRGPISTVFGQWSAVLVGQQGTRGGGIRQFWTF